jgi:hypothetical protein
VSVSFGSHGQKPTKRRTSRSSIVTFKGTLVSDNGHFLELRRGADVVELDAVGDRVAEYWDGRKLCTSNVGDRLMLLGVDLDAIALAEIVGVDRDGLRFRIKRVDGIAPVRPGPVMFMRVAL